MVITREHAHAHTSTMSTQESGIDWKKVDPNDIIDGDFWDVATDFEEDGCNPIDCFNWFNNNIENKSAKDIPIFFEDVVSLRDRAVTELGTNKQLNEDQVDVLQLVDKFIAPLLNCRFLATHTLTRHETPYFGELWVIGKTPLPQDCVAIPAGDCWVVVYGNYYRCNRQAPVDKEYPRTERGRQFAIEDAIPHTERPGQGSLPNNAILFKVGLDNELVVDWRGTDYESICGEESEEESDEEGYYDIPPEYRHLLLQVSHGPVRDE